MLRRILFHFLRTRPQRFKPVILVTGCASGIGLSLARLLARTEGYRVVVTARAASLPRLQSRLAENDRFLIRPLDVTDPSQRETLLEEIRERWDGVNILVNNAGLTYRAVVEHMTETDEQRQLAVNYLGPMGLIRGVLPDMRRAGRGKIISVSSVSGMLAMPTMASYSASKHALEGACEALWYEAKPYGIDVCLVQPGFVRSNSFQNVAYTELSKPENGLNSAYEAYYRNMTPFIEKMMGLSSTPPEKVARLILRTIQTENPPLWIPATIDARLFYYIRRLVPRRWLLPFLFACLPNARTWARGHSRKRERRSLISQWRRARIRK